MRKKTCLKPLVGGKSGMALFGGQTGNQYQN